MRTRYKKFEDYGIDENEKNQLFEMAKMQENKGLLRQACEMSNISLSKWLFDSLTNGISYYGFEKMWNFVPAKADDFYAYRRKAIFHFKQLLNLQSREEVEKK